MSKVTLNPPRAKKRPNSSRQPPFPIPVGSLLGRAPSVTDWEMYEGRLRGNRVVVYNPYHMENLYHMVRGFFGKRSRSPGDFALNKQAEAVDKSSDTLRSSGTSETNLTGLDISREDMYTATVEKEEAIIQTKKPELNANSPFINLEMLNLTLVEAFFLSFGLGCLTVTTDNNQKLMNLEEMWTTFCHLDPFFIYKYIAYHHFRSKGWVVKPGIKFGTHFILYKDGPPFYHASYSVIIKAVNEMSFDIVSQDHVNTDLGWSALMGVNRVTEHVAKDLLFCYVIQPININAEDMKHPSCISKFKVQEILLRRWVPSEERENEDNT